MDDNFKVSMKLANGKLLFKGNSRNNEEISMDYFPPLGDGAGYTGLELLLMSFSGCSATSIVYLLRKMGKTIETVTIYAEGIKREELPRAFREIRIKYIFKSPDVNSAEVLKAVKLSEESVCPVWSMLKGNVEVIPDFEIAS